MTPTRDDAAALDQSDPLAPFARRFEADDDLIYLDGNSLGRLPARARAALDAEVTRWATDVVGGWEAWIDLPQRLGAAVAPIIGASPDEVIGADSTSVNWYKLADAASSLLHDRSVLVVDPHDFPTDRYLAKAVADRHRLTVRHVVHDPAEPITLADVEAVLATDVAVVALSHVSYLSGAIVDMAAVGSAVREAGALTLWDLSHSAGSVPVALEDSRADLAVGCTYKYLNGGPGSPAYLYVRSDLIDRLPVSLPGWFGHDDQFAFAADYAPAPSMRKFLVGTPPVLSMAAAIPGIDLVAEAGMAAIRAKSLAATSLALDLYDAWLAPLGVGLRSPRDETRGSHLALTHPDALAISRWLRRVNVITDFRAPDVLRVAVAPLTTSFTDVWDGLSLFRQGLTDGSYSEYVGMRPTVT